SGARETSRPAASRTPVPGSAASLDRTSSPTRPHSRTRAGGATFTAPHTAPPLPRPRVGRAYLHRAPARPGRYRRGLRGQRGRPDRHAEPGFGQADRRGEADGPGPDYENVHEPTVSRGFLR